MAFKFHTPDTDNRMLLAIKNYLESCKKLFEDANKFNQSKERLKELPDTKAVENAEKVLLKQEIMEDFLRPKFRSGVNDLLEKENARWQLSNIAFCARNALNDDATVNQKNVAEGLSLCREYLDICNSLLEKRSQKQTNASSHITTTQTTPSATVNKEKEKEKEKEVENSKSSESEIFKIRKEVALLNSELQVLQQELNEIKKILKTANPDSTWEMLVGLQKKLSNLHGKVDTINKNNIVCREINALVHDFNQYSDDFYATVDEHKKIHRVNISELFANTFVHTIADGVKQREAKGSSSSPKKPDSAGTGEPPKKASSSEKKPAAVGTEYSPMYSASSPFVQPVSPPPSSRPTTTRSETKTPKEDPYWTNFVPWEDTTSAPDSSPLLHPTFTNLDGTQYGPTPQVEQPRRTEFRYEAPTPRKVNGFQAEPGKGVNLVEECRKKPTMFPKNEYNVLYLGTSTEPHVLIQHKEKSSGKFTQIEVKLGQQYASMTYPSSANPKDIKQVTIDTLSVVIAGNRNNSTLVLNPSTTDSYKIQRDYLISQGITFFKVEKDAPQAVQAMHSEYLASCPSAGPAPAQQQLSQEEPQMGSPRTFSM